jgi:hypothetical protein
MDIKGTLPEEGLAALHPWPVAQPTNWEELVNEPQTEEELEAVRRAGCHATPVTIFACF